MILTGWFGSYGAFVLLTFLGISISTGPGLPDLATTERVLTTLAELGVTEDDVSSLAENAALDPTAGTNPVPLTEDVLRDLITNTLTGEVV